jgi:hypothetical protein
VTVTGSWSGGASGGASCVTGVDGRCTVQKSNLKSQVSSITFTVDDLARSGMNYQPADNTVGETIAVGQNDTDRLPVAAGDSYQTGVDTPLTGNVMANDDQGDAPAIVYDNTLPAGGSLALGSDGAFTYSPGPGFEGSDGFTYRIVDQDGDVSDTAAVAIEVTGAEPPPPAAGGLSVSVLPYKVKGIQQVEVSWLDSASGSVDIYRDGAGVAGSLVDGDSPYADNIGLKGGGSYTYSVCEAGSSDCVEAVATF